MKRMLRSNHKQGYVMGESDFDEALRNAASYNLTRLVSKSASISTFPRASSKPVPKPKLAAVPL
jgi:hypothetical protein